MINNSKQTEQKPSQNQSGGKIETAFGKIQSHLLIKDNDTNEILVDKED